MRNLIAFVAIAIASTSPSAAKSQHQQIHALRSFEIREKDSLVVPVPDEFAGRRLDFHVIFIAALSGDNTDMSGSMTLAGHDVAGCTTSKPIKYGNISSDVGVVELTCSAMMPRGAMPTIDAEMKRGQDAKPPRGEPKFIIIDMAD